MSYPSDTIPAKDAFRHGHIMYSGIGGDYIEFQNGPFSYFVFYVLGTRLENSCVVVERDGKAIRTLVCNDDSTDGLTTDFFKKIQLLEVVDDYSNFDVPEVFFNRAK